MSDQGWTQEPWRIDPAFSERMVIVGEPGALRFLAVCTAEGSLEEDRSNAARIVSCVNALAGISNPAAVRELIEAVRDLSSQLELIDEVCDEEAALFDTFYRALAALDEEASK